MDYNYRESNENDCIIDELYGSPHPYNFCISEADKVLDKSGSRTNCDLFGTNCIKKNMVGFGKYLGSLFGHPEMILDASCGKQLGNKYVLKTNTKCVDENTETLVDRYTYINNMDNNKIFGISMLGDKPDQLGILPSSLSKATRINGAGLFTAITSEEIPQCKPIKLKCHLLNTHNKLYKGYSPYVHIDIDEINNISSNNKKDVANSKDHNAYKINKEGFNNTNISNNSNNSINSNNFDKKNILNDTYYFLLALILLYIIYKTIHKK